jgi:hypothetical protein
MMSMLLLLLLQMLGSMSSWSMDRSRDSIPNAVGGGGRAAGPAVPSYAAAALAAAES